MLPVTAQVMMTLRVSLMVSPSLPNRVAGVCARPAPSAGDRALTDFGEHCERALDGGRRGPGRTAQLDHRHEMRRIHRMRDETAGAPGQRLGEARRGNRRGGACEHGGRGRMTIELDEYPALLLERLGQVLLHPVRI